MQEHSAFDNVARRVGKDIDMRELNRTLAWRKSNALLHRKLADRQVGPRDSLTACPICAAESLAPFVVVHGFPYVTCGCCGHLFSQTPPRGSAITRLYAGDEQERSPQHKVYADETLFYRRVEKISRPKAEHVSSQVQPGGLWIDLGCATGELLFAAQSMGWEVLGIESDPVEVEFARGKGLQIQQGYIASDSDCHVLQNARVVSCLNVLEHIAQPAAWLRMVSRPLRPGTFVVIEIPRHPSLSAFANQLFPELASRHIYAPDHLHIFTERSAEMMLEQAGLVARSVWVFGQDFFDFISTAAAQSGITNTTYYEQVLKLVPTMQRSLDAMSFSDVLFVVAEKTSLGGGKHDG